MTEEEFVEAVTPLPEHDIFTFCPADWSLGSNNSFTRVYINFKNQTDIFTFRDKFDGYVFVDKKGERLWGASLMIVLIFANVISSKLYFQCYWVLL